MNIYTPSPPAQSSTSQPKAPKKKPRMALFQTMIWEGENSKAPAGRNMTYELPISPVSSTTCSTFESDIFPASGRSSTLSSDVFLTEPPAPATSPIYVSPRRYQGQGREVTLELPFSPVSSQGSKATSSEGEFEIYGYKARPIIPPSLNDLDLPVHPFNVFLPIPATEKADQTTEIQDKRIFPTADNLSLVDISPLSSPTNQPIPDRLNTSWISDGSFVPYDSDKSLPPTPPPKKMKKKISIGMSFPKKGGVSQPTRRCESCGQIILEKEQPN